MEPIEETQPTKRQIASRENGAKSKGPVTEEGKKKSSLNALKHGICSSSGAILQDESQEAFEALRLAFYEEFDPQSPSEIVLVEKLVACAWRTKRIYSMERQILEHEPSPWHHFIKETVPMFSLTRYEASVDKLYNQTLNKLQQIKESRPKPVKGVPSPKADMWQELMAIPDPQPKPKPRYESPQEQFAKLSREQKMEYLKLMTPEQLKSFGLS